MTLARLISCPSDTGKSFLAGLWNAEGMPGSPPIAWLVLFPVCSSSVSSHLPLCEHPLTHTPVVRQWAVPYSQVADSSRTHMPQQNRCPGACLFTSPASLWSLGKTWIDPIIPICCQGGQGRIGFLPGTLLGGSRSQIPAWSRLSEQMLPGAGYRDSEAGEAARRRCAPGPHGPSLPRVE